MFMAIFICFRIPQGKEDKYKGESTNTINNHEKRKRGRTKNTDWGASGAGTWIISVMLNI